jgi:putative endonuclease
MPAWCYILRLKSGNLYVGSTADINQRFQEHLDGYACRTTKYDPAIKLIYSEEFNNILEARKREIQIKKWTRAKKEALISGEMTKLQALAKSRKK